MKPGTAQGDLNINTSAHGLVIVGATISHHGAPTTIIDQTVLDRVFQMFSTVGLTGNTVTFENLIIEGGIAQEAGGLGTLPGSADAEGGGILDAEGGNIILSNVILQDNVAKAAPGREALGGGIYMQQGSLTIKDASVIQDNHALGAVGGTSTATEDAGAALGGGVFIEDQTTITNSTLSDNTVVGGASSTDGGPAAGGGIECLGQTTITNSTLSGNTVTGGSISGGVGGIAAGGGVDTFGPTTISNCHLLGNTVTGGSGKVGADAQGGGVFAGGNTTISNSILSGNILQGGTGNLSNFGVGVTGDVGGAAQGGGVYTSDKITLDISSSLLSDNQLTGGQGSYDDSSDSVSGDVGGEAQGGAVFASGPTTISDSILSSNPLTGGNGTWVTGIVGGNIGGSASGGGLYVNGPDGTVTITASTLSGNTLMGGSGSAGGGSATPGLAQGGGAYFAGGGDTLINSTIADNQAVGGLGVVTNAIASGGGLFFATTTVNGTPQTTLTNVTVADNKASAPQGNMGSTTTGGGIDHEEPDSGQVVLINTLVALNTAGTGPDFAGTANSTDHNLIGNADGSHGFGLGNSGDLLGSTANPLNPHLGALQINGGTTQTLALLPGSPAINAGDNTAQTTTGPFDQRGQGFSRVVDGTIDIGAFEVQPSGGSASGGSGSGGSSPSPTPPPLHTPPLLAFLDGLLGGVETVNSNGTETVTDRFFGITLFVSLYDSAGNLTSVTLFGINVTVLFELL